MKKELHQTVVERGMDTITYLVDPSDGLVRSVILEADHFDSVSAAKAYILHSQAQL